MLNWRTISEEETYKDLRYKVISKVEGIIKDVYYCSEKKATMGIGFNLQDNKVLKEVMIKLGFSKKLDEKTSTDHQYYKRAQDAVKNDISNKTELAQVQAKLNKIIQDKKGDSTSVFQFSDDKDIRDLFESLVADSYEGRVDNWLSDIPQSKERVVLVSMAWNGWINKGSSPSLKKAVEANNRAEAWYEIRYNTIDYSKNLSTQRNWATRHYYESEVFGLYDDGGEGNEITEDEANQVYSMFTNHREAILKYENTFGEANIESNNRRNYANSVYALDDDEKVQAIEQNFKPAYDFFKEKYIDPVNESINIDFRDIQVGTSKGDTLSGTQRNEYQLGEGYHQNDLIIGGAGNDTLNGNGGDDILYGGKDNDTISGGAGNDIIYGGSGQNTLSGGADNDLFLIKNEEDDGEASGSSGGYNPNISYPEYSTYNGGEGIDTIRGEVNKSNNIKVHNFQGEDTVEIIDGYGGTNNRRRGQVVSWLMLKKLDPKTKKAVKILLF